LLLKKLRGFFARAFYLRDFSRFAGMKSPVHKMFDEIASRYDFLNHTLSCFQDILWRRACCREIRKCHPGKRLLDLCGGTGDFAVTYEKFNGVQDVAILGDFSYGMLAGAAGKKTTAAPVQLDAMRMPFADASFDVVLNGFGMRNLPDAESGLRESARVLSAGGYLQVLEFFSPRGFFNKIFYKRLAPLFIPVLGAFFSKRDAYEYLVNSIIRFLPVDEFVSIAERNGFECVHVKPCFWGVAFRVLLRRKGGAVAADAGEDAGARAARADKPGTEACADGAFCEDGNRADKVGPVAAANADAFAAGTFSADRCIAADAGENCANADAGENCANADAGKNCAGSRVCPEGTP